MAIWAYSSGDAATTHRAPEAARAFLPDSELARLLSASTADSDATAVCDSPAVFRRSWRTTLPRLAWAARSRTMLDKPWASVSWISPSGQVSWTSPGGSQRGQLVDGG
ncbi:hypothetical protein [Saccharopolyspora spinosa]|uniref:Uncharacterized protein n=1 Tax=Saccharopolyspora spinosa TaxID=60894 RepID=A0A2N3Y2Z7_SACSN|nr:hypothetical protein [Saccharopolyspora spinosa]PKW17277.1 hypothetical protein A8926_5220 [Saccharopolyspora spinosa]